MLSIILSIIISQSTADTLLVKGTRNISYRLYISNDNLCFQYQAGRNWSEPIILDSGDISEYSVALTTGDYLHIVWCKAGRVCYRTNDEPITPMSVKDNRKPQLSPFIFISTYFTEPAFNISIKSTGEWIYAVWRVSNELQPEVWARRRWLLDPPNEWEVPVNGSYYLK